MQLGKRGIQARDMVFLLGFRVPHAASQIGFPLICGLHQPSMVNGLMIITIKTTIMILIIIMILTMMMMMMMRMTVIMQMRASQG